MIETLTSYDRLADLASEWGGLWRRTPTAAPFLAPAWLLAWTRSFAPPRVLALACRRDGELAALLPLYLDEEAVARPLGVAVSDEFDMLGDPSAAEAFLERLAAEGVRRIDLPDLAAGSPLAAGAPGWSAAPGPSTPRSGLGLPATFPPRKRRQLRTARHRAARWGDLTVERTGPEGLDVLFDLHAARWESRGKAGVLADPRVREMHRLAAPGLAEEGLLQISVLRLAGRPAAALYGFRAHGRGYAYLTGMDPAFAYASPGALLLADAIGQAAAEGASRYEFLRGDESYKAGWGAERSPGQSLVLRRAGAD